ncbi:hypothetical protein PHMEG_00031791, partial [Phytophthora megakarya]
YEAVTEGQYKCRLCVVLRKQLPRSGYSNLTENLSLNHLDFQERFQQSHGARSLVGHGILSEKPSELYCWVRWVVQRDLSICELENNLTRSMRKPITAKALLKAIEGVSIKVSQKLEVEMGESFGLIFDGWSQCSMHYVGFFVVYCVDNQLRVQLLGLLTLEDGSHTADGHQNQTRRVWCTGAMVSFLLGDACVTNKAIQMTVPLMECASRRFNLVVKKRLASHRPILVTVNSLMVQLRQPNNAAQLAKLKT